MGGEGTERKAFQVQGIPKVGRMTRLSVASSSVQLEAAIGCEEWQKVRLKK